MRLPRRRIDFVSVREQALYMGRSFLTKSRQDRRRRAPQGHILYFGGGGVSIGDEHMTGDILAILMSTVATCGSGWETRRIADALPDDSYFIVMRVTVSIHYPIVVFV